MNDSERATAALRELRDVLQQFQAVARTSVAAQMSRTELTHRLNQLAALERGDVRAYEANREGGKR